MESNSNATIIYWRLPMINARHALTLLAFFSVLIFSSGCGGGGGSASQATAPPDPFVIVIAGQSQVTNGIPDRFTARASVSVFWNGELSRAADPLPGSALTQGTIASRLGDALAARTGVPVVLLNYGVGGTAIAEWAPGTGPHQTLTAQIEKLNASGLAPDLVLWMQGESDCYYGTTVADYKAGFAALLAGIREHTDAPVYVAQETHVEGRTCPSLRSAQAALPGTRPGPDLDTIGNDMRKDRTHFTTPGAERAVALWLEKLL
jgi:hypothetical protein